MDEPDLYADLFEDLGSGQSVIKTSFHELEERILQLSNEGNEMRSQVEDLQSQKEKLQNQNEVLIRNISCLFKTAQMEIARKDKQIKGLQEENLKLTLNGSTPRPPANLRQSTAGAWSKKEHNKTNFPTHTDLATESRNADSSVCNGSFRKRVRGTDSRQASEEEDCAAMEVEQERRLCSLEGRKRQEREDIHRSRNESHSAGTDAFRERKRDKWHHTHSNRRERGSQNEEKVPRDSSKHELESMTKEISLDTEISGHNQSAPRERGSHDEERVPRDSLKPNLESKTKQVSLETEISGHNQSTRKGRGIRSDERVPRHSLKTDMESKTRGIASDKETSGRRFERRLDHRDRRDDR